MNTLNYRIYFHINISNITTHVYENKIFLKIALNEKTEGVGFEPTVQLLAHRLSRSAP